MNIKPLQIAIKRAGGQTALAELIGAKQANVWNWLHRDKKVSPRYVIKIEKAVGVSRHDLRPDIYPKEDDVHLMA